MGDRDLDKLMRSGLIVVGAGKILMVDERVVGFCYPTTNGQFHVFADSGERLDVFSSQREADDFAERYWKEDGTVAPDFVPIRLQ
jgi:hypothetical protein